MTDEPTTAHPSPTGPAHPTGLTRAADGWTWAFYLATQFTAFVGQVAGAPGWLHVAWYWAIGPAAILELGGIALSARADVRRRLGERAYIARALSAAVVVFAVLFNWYSHGSVAGWFFAGASALGYAVYLLMSGDRRRDALRAAGKLADTSHSYGLGQWTRHPVVTGRARRLAQADRSLTWSSSLEVAAEQLRAEARRRAIAKAVRKSMTARKGDKLAARIVLSAYDLDRLASEVEKRADYGAWADLIGDTLTPAQTAAPKPARPMPAEAQPIPAAPARPKAARGPARAGKPKPGRPALGGPTPAVAAMVAQLLDDYTDATSLPSRGKAKARYGWTSNTQTDKALAHARAQLTRVPTQPINGHPVPAPTAVN